MIVGYMIFVLNSLAGSTVFDTSVYKPDGGQIYSSEFECNQRLEYYVAFSNEDFNNSHQLVCGEVKR